MKEKLAEIFKNLFGVTELRDDMSPENVEKWDSFSQIELIIELENAFQVTIPTQEAVLLDSVAKITAYLEPQIQA